MSFINSYTPPNKGDVDISLNFKDPYDLNSSIPVPPILESERVCLVPFIPSIHAESFYTAFLADAESIGRYLPFSWGKTLDTFLAFIESFVRQDPSSALFAIIDKTQPGEDPERIPQGRIAGAIGWLHGSLAQLSLEFGPVVVLPTFQRTFVSANAIGLLLKYVLDVPEQGGMGFRRVAWCASPMNAASISAAEKMGFTKEGVIRWSWVLVEGQRGKQVEEGRGSGDGRDSVLLSVCWDDWVSGVRDLVVKRMNRV